jgi:hypothetical protein
VKYVKPGCYVEIVFACVIWVFFLLKKWPVLIKVINFVPFRLKWLKHSIPIQKTEQNRTIFHLILNLGPFWIFRLNFDRNVPVSFHMFRSALEKSLNQIEL